MSAGKETENQLLEELEYSDDEEDDSFCDNESELLGLAFVDDSSLGVQEKDNFQIDEDNDGNGADQMEMPQQTEDDALVAFEFTTDVGVPISTAKLPRGAARRRLWGLLLLSGIIGIVAVSIGQHFWRSSGLTAALVPAIDDSLEYGRCDKGVVQIDWEDDVFSSDDPAQAGC